MVRRGFVVRGFEKDLSADAVGTAVRMFVGPCRKTVGSGACVYVGRVDSMTTEGTHSRTPACFICDSDKEG